MRLFSSGKIYDFMAVRWYWIGLSLIITFGAAALLLMGKARLGTDFTGGTEVEIAFKRPVSAADLRAAVLKAGFSAPAATKSVCVTAVRRIWTGSRPTSRPSRVSCCVRVSTTR